MTRTPRQWAAGQIRYALAERVARKAASGAPLVAVAHGYYPEAWPVLAAALKRGLPDGTPILVTVPVGSPVAGLVRADFPDAAILPVPNRGRDVLPFLHVARALQRSGVRYVVKVHGKVSAHADDGAGWLHSSLADLLSSPERSAECVGALEGGAALVGPASQFVPMSTYWEPNRKLVEAVAGPVDDPSAWSFFAGTMWWARLDALAEFASWGFARFPAEAGQYDGTPAHAFERLVCLRPQQAGIPLAVASERGVNVVS